MDLDFVSNATTSNWQYYWIEPWLSIRIGVCFYENMVIIIIIIILCILIFIELHYLYFYGKSFLKKVKENSIGTNKILT